MKFPAAGTLAGFLYLFCLAVTIGGALLAVLTPRIIRSVCGLAICCLGLAGLYFFLRSPFLALMEILIYIGAVCVTIIFAIMMAEPDEAPPEGKTAGRFVWGALAVAICSLVFLGLSHLSSTHVWASPVKRLNDGSVNAIGVSLLTTYSMAFELISLVLLAAILGALVVARGGKGK
jgi:NADH:ubiquinone oxidoreductase subunit 6 (subunit J)